MSGSKVYTSEGNMKVLSDKEDIKHEFKNVLRDLGITGEFGGGEDLGWFTVIKVTTEDTAKKFAQKCEEKGIKSKASTFKDSDDIWVFKAYHYEK